MRSFVSARAVLICLLSSWSALALAEEWEGRVVSVADGDTIAVLRDQTLTKIRLEAVDAPEKAQAFGDRAKQFTSGLVSGKNVRVRVATKDKYGRTVAWVYLAGKCLNEELLRAGMAWHYLKYDKSKALQKLEDEARAERRGLWADPKPTPPWEWRHSKKDQGSVAPRAPAKAPPVAKGPLHGNTRAKVFHRPGCKGYDCKHCTAEFPTRKAAIEAGYRPCGACKP